jgi:predicted nuclease with RNAse H fold
MHATGDPDELALSQAVGPSPRPERVWSCYAPYSRRVERPDGGLWPEDTTERSGRPSPDRWRRPRRRLGGGATPASCCCTGPTCTTQRPAVVGRGLAAVDCPLGWPEPFVEFLLSHRTGQGEPPPGLSGLAWRWTLSRRTTDLAREVATGVRPLSVSADRIAAVATRGAALQGALATRGRPVDRADGGRVVECYPAAALKAWGLQHQAYKRAAGAAALDLLTTALLTELPALQLGPFEQLVRSSDDAFDAVVCALMARAAAVGAVTGPPPEHQKVAAKAGSFCRRVSSAP